MKRSFLQAIGLGFAGGCLGGAIAGLVEGWWVLSHASGSAGAGVVGYAVLFYGIIGALGGAAAGVFLEAAWRVARKGISDARLYALSSGAVLALVSLVVWRFLLGRDVFQEKLGWGSPAGLAMQLGLVVGALCVVYVFWKVLGRLLEVMAGRFVLMPWFMPVVVAVLGGALLALSGGGGGGGGDGGGKKPAELKGPNVILIMVDTLRADCTDPYGADGVTPNMKQFAKESVTFDRAYAQASWTRPSVATVLSGRYPSSHRAVYKMDQLPPAVETVSEVLQGEGYETAAMVTNYVTSPYFGFGQGFDRYHYLEPSYFLGASDASSKLLLYEITNKIWSKLVAKGSKPGAHYQDGKTLTDEAIKWLDKRNGQTKKGEKFFFFLQYMDPHDPYFSHPDDGRAIARKVTPNPPRQWLGRMKELYTGEVRHFDEQLGRLLAYMKKQPWWDETLVILFSDHGEEFLEHGGWWHGDTLFEEQIRVPLMVRLPKGEAAGEVMEKDLVGLVDIAPTICRLAGAKIPKGFQGQDLFEQRTAPIFSEEDHVGNSLRSIVYLKGDQFWKIIAANENNPRGVPAKSLFNLTGDPGEQENLAAAQAEEYGKAGAQLAKIEKQVAEGAVDRKTIELDAAAKGHLTDLGYIREEEDTSK
ncbi:MAG: sulfatase [Pseudomonadota bacterium]